MDYIEAEKKILNVLEKTTFCTLATANKLGVVCATQMCLVNNGLKVYIQTDKTFEKVKNILENENVAINCGPYYFKGVAKIIGHPTENSMFVEKLKIKHLDTYKHYTNLPNEVLIEITLTEGKIWGIDNTKDIHNQETIFTVDFVNKTVSKLICDKM